MENGEDRDIHRVCTTVLPSIVFQQIKHPSVLIFLPASNSNDFKRVSHMKKSSSDSNLKLGCHSEETELRVQVWLHLR